jgi:hypothetical protein
MPGVGATRMMSDYEADFETQFDTQSRATFMVTEICKLLSPAPS